MCMTTKHISHPPCPITHSSATNMAMDDKQEPYFNQSEDAISYLSTSWNSRINEGKDYRVPILPLANELLYPGDNNTDNTSTTLPFFNGPLSSPYFRKSRILITQGLSISTNFVPNIKNYDSSKQQGLSRYSTTHSVSGTWTQSFITNFEPSPNKDTAAEDQRRRIEACTSRRRWNRNAVPPPGAASNMNYLSIKDKGMQDCN